MKTTIKSTQVSSFSTVLCLLILFANSSFAGSATWKSSPATGDWNTATNWTPQTVPNGSSDVATFATSNQTAVSLSNNAEVNEISFSPGASPFTITVPPNNSGFSLNITGIGVTNNSGTTQSFVAAADFSSFSNFSYIQFFDGATAGSSTSYAVNKGAVLEFHNTSTAGSAAFTVTGDPSGQTSALVFFDSATAQNGNFTANARAEIAFGDSSSAGNGTFTINSGNVSFSSSVVLFSIGSSAGNARFTINGSTLAGNGSQVGFSEGASAGAATFIAKPGSNGGQGGSVRFASNIIGGTSRIELFGNGTGDETDGFLALFRGGATIGSLEGSGSVFLGAKTLTVGSNNLSTTFSGMIVDCTTCGSAGSFAKIGKGKLALSHSSGNTYTGGTTINKGILIATNNTGSATGSALCR